MITMQQLDGLDLAPTVLEHELVVTIATPVAGVEPLLKALGEGHNPNRYWNQPNAAEIHGDAIEQH